MKRLHFYKILSLSLLCIYLNGCLLVEDTSTTEEPSVGSTPDTPPDFEIRPPADENGSLGEPEEEDPQAELPPATPINPELDVVINNGEAYTKNGELSVEFLAPSNTLEMKVGSSETCTDGTWQVYSRFQNLPVKTINALNRVSVQYRNAEFQTSTCVSRSIIHDDKGPEILFTRYPTAVLEEGSAVELEYQVSDTAGVKSVGCSLNSINKTCAAGTQVVYISALPTGDYSFLLSAQDSLGNSSSLSVGWSVVSGTKKLTQNIRVNNYKKVDILINIDNSGSMQYEQQNMAHRVRNFLSILRGLDYQIAVTTTDPRNIELGNGELLPIYGTNTYILDSSTPEETAQYRLGMTLQRKERGSGSEQAIYTSTRVIEKSLKKKSAAHKNFIRDGAQLAVLVISDEDESDNGNKNDPENLLKLIHDSYDGQKTFTWHSIITRPDDKNCRQTDGYSYGHRYNQFSKLTGGLIGSVCESDYATQVSDIATGIRNMLKTLTLKCQALSQLPIVVKKDGQPFSGSFVIEGVNLKFESELDPGDYSVEYRCLK